MLLDTHVLIWFAGRPDRLSRRAAAVLQKAEQASGLAVAAVTLWEIALLLGRGRVRLAGTIENAIETILRETGVAVRPLTPQVAALAVTLPREFPKDPADRLIAATALAEGTPLVTADVAIRRAAIVKTIW